MNKTEKHPDQIHSLSTLTAIVGVKAVTFNSWRKRNGLFPRTQTEKGWSYYSVADICVACTVKWLTAQGNAAQFAVDAAMALLPRFETMDRDARAFNKGGALPGSLVKTIAVIMLEDDAEAESETQIALEFYAPTASLHSVFRNSNDIRRLGWGNATFLDLFDVYQTVLIELGELKADRLMTAAERDRMTMEVLVDQLQASLEDNTHDKDD